MAMYLGVATVGIFGGALLERFSAPHIGFSGPIASACLVLILAWFNPLPISAGLVAAFLIFVFGEVEPKNSNDGHARKGGRGPLGRQNVMIKIKVLFRIEDLQKLTFR